jgi:hypothetical protein
MSLPPPSAPGVVFFGSPVSSIFSAASPWVILFLRFAVHFSFCVGDILVGASPSSLFGSLFPATDPTTRPSDRDN